VIQTPDTSTESLEHIQRLQATVRSQELEMEVGCLSVRVNQLTAAGIFSPLCPHLCFIWEALQHVGLVGHLI